MKIRNHHNISQKWKKDHFAFRLSGRKVKCDYCNNKIYIGYYYKHDGLCDICQIMVGIQIKC